MHPPEDPITLQLGRGVSLVNSFLLWVFKVLYLPATFLGQLDQDSTFGQELAAKDSTASDQEHTYFLFLFMQVVTVRVCQELQ